VYANALGQIAEVKDAYAKSLSYLYNSQGNLTRTTDSAGNIIEVGYDILGRRTSLDDPDLGMSSYTLDAFSQLRTQTDAKGQTLAMRYDILGRLEERDVPLTADPHSPVETSFFSYDDATLNAVGKPSSIVQGVNGGQLNAKHFGYDQYGRPDSIITYIKGERFAEALTYTANGQLDSRQYPDSGVDANNAPMKFVVKYDYVNGFLSEISGVDASGAACISHWKANEYDAFGRTKVDTLGNIITTTRTYDPAQGVLDKIESIVTVGSAGTVQNLDYGYDANNNLKSRDDGFTNVNETFTYDELDRLRFHYKGADTVEVNYNDLGNITSKSDVGSYSYTGQGGPHAVSRVNSPLGSYDPLAKFQVNWEWNGEAITNQNQANVTDSDYQYDANGNIKVQGNRSVSWTTLINPPR
jgi:YD repeat-containing protein